MYFRAAEVAALILGIPEYSCGPAPKTLFQKQVFVFKCAERSGSNRLNIQSALKLFIQLICNSGVNFNYHI